MYDTILQFCGNFVEKGSIDVWFFALQNNCDTAVTINKKDRSDFYCGRCFELESYLVAKVHENAIFQDPPYEKIHSLAATAALLWMVKMYRYSRVIKFLRNFEFRNCARNERWADVA